MSDANFTCSINAPFEKLWKTLIDEVEHPNNYNNKILGVKILERFNDGVLRSVQVPDADVREKIVFDFEQRTIRSSLVGHPSLVGIITRTIIPIGDDIWELKSNVTWESVDDRVDGMIRRNIESFITQGLKKVKERAEA